MRHIYRACLALGRSYGFDEEHSLHDARLAVRLFDVLSSLLNLEERHRVLLFCAGMLHDIGYAEGYWRHHITAYRLIMQSDLPGLTEDEKRIVANVARYHRGSRPRLRHGSFSALAVEDREAVIQLAAILRLADGLDRSHTGAVRGLDLWADGDRLVLLLDCPLGCSAEVWAGEKKGRFLAEVLDLRLDIRERMGA